MTKKLCCTVSGDAFIEAMKERGISKAILNRNKQYIGNKIAIFKVQSTSRVVSLNKGCSLCEGTHPWLYLSQFRSESRLVRSLLLPGWKACWFAWYGLVFRVVASKCQ